MNLIVTIISLGFTIAGAVYVFQGDLTNGLLMIIVGELTDMPKRTIRV